jgi:hypothetical protein
MGRMTSHIWNEKKHLWNHQPATVQPATQSLSLKLWTRRPGGNRLKQWTLHCMSTWFLRVSAVNGMAIFWSKNAQPFCHPWIKQQDSPQLENLDMIYDDIGWDMMRCIKPDSMIHDDIFMIYIKHYKTNQKIPDIFSDISRHLISTSPAGNSQRGMSAGHRAA